MTIRITDSHAGGERADFKIGLLRRPSSDVLQPTDDGSARTKAGTETDGDLPAAETNTGARAPTSPSAGQGPPTTAPVTGPEIRPRIRPAATWIATTDLLSLAEVPGEAPMPHAAEAVAPSAGIDPPATESRVRPPPVVRTGTDVTRTYSPRTAAWTVGGCEKQGGQIRPFHAPARSALRVAQIHGLLGWLYVAACAVFQPLLLAEPVASQLPIRRDVFGACCIAVSTMAYFLLWLVPRQDGYGPSRAADAGSRKSAQWRFVSGVPRRHDANDALLRTMVFYLVLNWGFLCLDIIAHPGAADQPLTSWAAEPTESTTAMVFFAASALALFVLGLRRQHKHERPGGLHRGAHERRTGRT